VKKEKVRNSHHGTKCSGSVTGPYRGVKGGIECHKNLGRREGQDAFPHQYMEKPLEGGGKGGRGAWFFGTPPKVIKKDQGCGGFRGYDVTYQIDKAEERRGLRPTGKGQRNQGAAKTRLPRNFCSSSERDTRTRKKKKQREKKIARVSEKNGGRTSGKHTDQKPRPYMT